MTTPHSSICLLRPASFLPLPLVAVLFIGCGETKGPELAEVYGTVKLDGQPLPGARLRFVPVEGSPSLAVTDEEGRFELQYSNAKSGAVVGTHTVRISTARRAGEDDERNETPAVPEKVPAQYNVESASNPEMKKEVKPGSNEFHFELKSGGKVIQPATDQDG